MLEIFLGGYLFHPAALDYSGDTCKNGCAYCFANINKEERRGNLTGAINAIHKKEPITYRDLLVKMGYPICVSNRSDPFTPRNVRDTVALFTHLARIPNGIFIQTKTGPGMDEALGALEGKKNVAIYITITTIRDSVARLIEPGAPSPNERLRYAKALHAAGYLTIIAMNPLSEAWMPREDIETMAATLKDYGINHVCLEMLDIKRKRLSMLASARKARLGDAVHTLGDANRAYVRAATQYFIHEGFQVAKKGMPNRTKFFSDLSDCLGLTMPVMQDFVNYCFDRYGGDGGVVGFDEFEAVMARGPVFNGTLKQNNIRDYLLRSGFVSWKENKQVHSHKELLKIVWNDPRHRISIQRHSLFTVIGRDGKPEPDQDGNVRLWFDGQPNLSPKKGVKST
jgi:DNA repair photolyase